LSGAFPEFNIDPLRLGLSPGSHTIEIGFTDATFGAITVSAVDRNF